MVDTLLKSTETAKRLQVSVGTVRAYADKGILPVVTLPSGHRRFRAGDVDRLRQQMGLDVAPGATGEGPRVRSTRERWGLTTDQLATSTGVPVDAIESGETELEEADAAKLAEALQVRVEWLLTGDGEMVAMHQMTQDEQVVAQTGPGSEGLPGFVVLDGGVWYRDSDDTWVVELKGRTQ